MIFQVHEAEACLPSPGEGGVHGGSRLLGPAAADAEGVLAALGGGRFGRKREHFKLGVVFMIASVDNSLFWSGVAAGRAKLLLPPAKARARSAQPTAKAPKQDMCYSHRMSHEGLLSRCYDFTLIVVTFTDDSR